MTDTPEPKKFTPLSRVLHWLTAALVFAEKEPLGYVSDHIGLCTRLFLTPSR